MRNYEQNDSENLHIEAENHEPLNSASSVPTPDNPPWNNWTALGAWAASVAFIVIFPNLFLLPYLAKQSVKFADKQALIQFAKTDATAVLLQIISVFPAHLCTLLLAWLIVTRFRKYSFRQTLGWDLSGFKIWHSLAIVAAFILLGVGLAKIFGEPANDFQEMLKTSRTIVFVVAILATFTAPIVEEVIYRGILYSSLQRKLGVAWAVVTVTFLFAIIHVPQYSKNYIPDVPTVTLLFLLSLTLTLIRVRTKNLLPCIALHTIFNGIQSLLLIAEPYLSEFAKQHSQPGAAILHFLK